MKRLALLLCVPFIAMSIRAVEHPRPEQFPVALYKGKRAPLVLTADDRMFRTRLRYAYDHSPVNFAGKYVFTAWGCGGGCLMGAAIDTSTGRVRWLPGTFSGYTGGGEVFTFEPGSALLIGYGSLNETGDVMQWFYRLTPAGRWVLVASISFDED